MVSIAASVVPTPVIPHMVTLGLLALISAAGLYRKARWGLAISLIAIALSTVVSLTEAYVFWMLFTAFGEVSFAALSALLWAMTVLAALLFLYVLSKRVATQSRPRQPH